MKRASCVSLFFTLVLTFASSGAALAQSAETPVFKDSDKWVYNVVEEKNVAGAMSSSARKWENRIVRAGSKSISVSSKPLDSNMPPREVGRGVDWSVTDNIGGKSTLTSRPYDFPLKPGKTWKLEYVVDNPDARTKFEKISKQYTVIDWVDVKVPAGTYRALKLEMEGEWAKEFNTIAPSATSAVSKGDAGSVAVAQTRNATTPKPVSGKLYQAFWYVPEIKRYVKFITEDYQSGGSLNKRITEELESAQLN